MTSNQKAILAGGCFWGLQDLIRNQPGVVSTRVGYSGGNIPNATYRRCCATSPSRPPRPRASAATVEELHSPRRMAVGW